MEFILEIICLKKIKDGAYVINLDEIFSYWPHWIALYALNNNVTYFDSFGAEYFQKILKNLSIDLQSQQIFIKYKHMI